MKKRIAKTIMAVCLTALPLMIFGQASGPTAPPSNPENGTGKLGGNAPIGSGLSILLALGLGYGTKKTYRLFNNR